MIDSLTKTHNLLSATSTIIDPRDQVRLDGGSIAPAREFVLHDAWIWVKNKIETDVQVEEALKYHYNLMDANVSPTQFWQEVESSDCDNLLVALFRCGYARTPDRNVEPTAAFLFEIIEKRLLQIIRTRNVKGLAIESSKDGSWKLVPALSPSIICPISTGTFQHHFYSTGFN